MPTLGLKELEILRLQDTESLKRFPSIYNFEVSFHCAKPHAVGADSRFTKETCRFERSVEKRRNFYEETRKFQFSLQVVKM
jgi:hypothetical protein